MGEVAANGKPDPAAVSGNPFDPATRGFVHLHLHSEYSLLDGANRLDKLCARVKELGMPAVAVTDHGNIFGAAAFYLAAKEAGIKPILGVEAYVTPPERNRRDKTYTGVSDGGYHLVLLAENNTGWQNLLVLCSEAYLTGFYFKPRIDRELLEKHSEGLIAINGHLGSEIGDHLLALERTGDAKWWDKAVESAEWHKRVFGPNRFYVELQHHVREQNAINKHLVKLARQVGVPLVCDNDSHFLKSEDHDAHDTLICISMGKIKSDPDRLRYPEELYVKSPQEMRKLFEGEYGDIGREACDNTLKIAERCAGAVTLPIGANNSPMVRVKVPAAKDLPRHDAPEYAGDPTAWYKAYCAKFEVVPFSLPPGASEDDKKNLLTEAKAECDKALRMLSEAGFVWRYGRWPDAKAPLQEDRDKVARLERELKILCDKNITAYFLIVWDFVNWGRQQNIPAIARGSGVGTMVGYVLGLSNACPVKYGLLFERFTDPDRSEYPDIDIDLCQDGRGRVIDYVRRKYGHVAQIITFGTLKARAAVRDVCRVMDVPLPEADKLAKLIPEQLHITLDDALTQEPELKKQYDTDDRIRKVIDNARVFEGQTRHASVHAAGVIVATRPLQEIVPLYKQSGAADHEIVTQWDGPTCEKMGLLKMDFLGLRTLSVIERAKKLIRETLSEEEIWKAVGRGGEFGSPSQREGAGGRVNRRNEPDQETGASVVETAGSGSPPPNPLPLGGGTGHPLDLDRLTFDDPKVFSLFQRADTTGVFQFESGGMRRLLVEMRPDRLEDLIAANALFRPGPMDLIPDYNRRKHGQAEVPNVHPIVDQYTGETYGVMVYQEQVMQIVHGLGGIKLRDAYSLIKNISKKKHDKIEKERPKFVDGAQKQGLSKSQAEDLFELILKFAGYGFNKCVVGETTIVDARSGERTTVEDLFRNRRDFDIHAIDGKGKLRPRRVTDVVWNGRKPVFELRTRQGRVITATANHPFYTLDGWTNLGDLRVGDRIAAPRKLEVPTEQAWPDHEIVTLAGLLSEGSTCHPTCLYFFGNEPRLVQDFSDAAGKFPETEARTYARGDGRLEVCVSTGQDTRFRPGQRPWNSPRAEGGVATADPAVTSVRSGAYRWAKELGILGLKATAKRVPSGVFQLRDANVELFLGRLWAGDGYIAGRSSSTPFYATSSMQLARDVQLLLTRLGIGSGIHAKSFKYRGGARPGYTVHLVGEGSVRTFLQRIAPHCTGREAQVALLQERSDQAPPGLTSKDTVPADIRSWVDEERRASGLTWRELESRSGVCTRELCRMTPGAKRGFRRTTVARLAEFFGSEKLRDTAESDIFWDEVVAIEPKGEQDTYDLTVDVDHNFVADGLIVHNSHSTGYAIVAYQTAYLKTYFPNQYMAAFLTFESGAQKVSDWIQYVEDCKKTRFTNGKVGVEVRPPDVNLSQSDFAVVYDDNEPHTALNGHVRFGMGAIKGVGEKAIELVLRERDGVSGPPSQREGAGGRVAEQEVVSDPKASSRGKAARSENPPPNPLPLGGGTKRPFNSIFDFCERVLAAGAAASKSNGTGGGSGGAALNKTTVEALVRCGAMDCLHGRENRAAMLAAIEAALTAGQKAAADLAAGQGGLFMGGGGGPADTNGKLAKSQVEAKPLLPKVTPWHEAETLAHEKAALGFYVSSHPLERWRPWASVFVTATTESAKQVAQDGRVVMACLVQAVRTIIIKNGRSAGQKMGIVTFEDTQGTVEGVMFSECFAQFGHHLTTDNVVFVLGRVDRSRSAGGGRPQRGGKGAPATEEDAANQPTENTLQIVVDRVVPIDGVPLMPGRLWLLVDGNRLNGGSERALQAVAAAVREGAGEVSDRTVSFPIDLVVDTQTQRVRLEAAKELRVQPTPELVTRIAAELGDGCIRVVGGMAAENPNARDRSKWSKPKGG